MPQVWISYCRNSKSCQSYQKTIKEAAETDNTLRSHRKSHLSTETHPKRAPTSKATMSRWLLEATKESIHYKAGGEISPSFPSLFMDSASRAFPVLFLNSSGLSFGLQITVPLLREHVPLHNSSHHLTTLWGPLWDAQANSSDALNSQ